MKKPKNNKSTHKNTAYKAVCFVLALLIFIFALFFNECMLLWRYENLRDSDGVIKGYISEQTTILANRNMLNNLSGSNNGLTSAAVSICINSTDKTLISTAFPLIKKYGYVASFVLREDALPGTESYISELDYQMLIKSGWMAVIAGDGGIDLSSPGFAEEYSAYLDDYAEKLIEHNITFPHIFLLETPDPAGEYLDVLKDHGINMILQSMPPEKQKKQHIGFWSHGIYFCGTSSIQTAESTVQQTIYDAGIACGSITVITRNVTDSVYADPVLDCSVSKYTQCLDWFRSDSSYYSFSVTSLDVMFREKEAVYNEYKKYLGDAGTPQERYAQLNEELSQTSDKIYCYSRELSEPISHGFGFSEFMDFVKLHGVEELIKLKKDYYHTIEMYRRSDNAKSKNVG